MSEVEVSMNKIYKLPEFKIIEYADCFLAIDVENAKWIVLQNSTQVQILKRFVAGYSIEEVCDEFPDAEELIVSILIQIEAKKIERKNVTSVFSNTKLHLHLTNKCNMRCAHCYMKAGKEYKDELSCEEIKKLLDCFRNKGGTNVSITGGEPVMRKDFLEIIEYADKVGLTISIFSNGVLWDEQLIKKIAGLNVEGVQISVDGYDESSNAIIRGTGFFEKALNTIDLLIKNGVYVKVAVTPAYEVLRHNSEKFIEFSRFLLEKYTDDCIEINYSFFLMEGRNLDKDTIRREKDEYYKMIEKIVLAVHGEYEEDAFVVNLLNHKRDSCGFGGLNVMANGDYYFCDRVPSVNKIGNIRNTCYDDIYEHMKKAEKAGLIDNFKPCSNCELKNICGGGCRAEFFPEFTELIDFSCVDFESIPARKCEEKEHIIQLMINTNERFFEEND